MAHSNDDFTADAIDEQVEHFLQLSAPEQQTPSAAVTQALSAMFEEDTASIERVRQRYVDCLQRVVLPDTQFSESRSLSVLQGEKYTVRDVDVDESTTPVFVLPAAQRKRRWIHYVGVFAAVLCVALLIGGFSTLMNMAHSTQTPGNSQVSFGGGHKTQPTSTRESASLVFQRAFLAAEPLNGEGIGPGYSGLHAQTHFTVGQQIMLLFDWSAHESGPVVVKWYADGQVYQTIPLSMCYVAPYQGTGIAPTPKTSTSGCEAQATPAPGSPSSVPFSGSSTIIFTQPTTGKVELYWNGQLAVTLPFVVSAS